MKFTISIVFLLFLFGITLAQNNKKQDFDSHSIYYQQSDTEWFLYGNNSKIQTAAKYNRIPCRTIAVNPKIILIGSIVFIPDAVGLKLSDGTYHDGYFLAHDKLASDSGSSLGIYTGGNSECDFRGHLKDGKKINLYVVRGIMERVTRLKFSQEYELNSPKPTWKMAYSDFDKLMKDGNKKNLTVNERIQYYSELGLGTPYVIFNLGEGPGASPDPDPLIDFGRVDCMTFCENTLALAISGSYDEMYNNLQKIRYKGGKIDYITRNHYTIADWLPNNSWLLRDVTDDIGRGYTRNLVKQIDRQAFYQNNGVDRNKIEKPVPVQTIHVKYVPTEDLLKVKNRFQGGEIVSIVTTYPGVVSAHMGIIVKDEWGNIIFRHGSSRKETSEVIDQKFEEVVEDLSKSKSRIGMIFMRALEDFRIPD
ncbi:MAG: N-acetylmuramoyl-L-alanine amidase-like domain-containing protein [Calditrichaceae bacterium]